MATDKSSRPVATKDLEKEALSVPADILLDILAIILAESLIHEITQVNTNRSTVSLLVYIQPEDNRQRQALQNIRDLLQEYNDYRWEEANDSSWRDR